MSNLFKLVNFIWYSCCFMVVIISEIRLINLSELRFGWTMQSISSWTAFELGKAPSEISISNCLIFRNIVNFPKLFLPASFTMQLISNLVQGLWGGSEQRLSSAIPFWCSKFCQCLGCGLDIEPLPHQGFPSHGKWWSIGLQILRSIC